MPSGKAGLDFGPANALRVNSPAKGTVQADIVGDLEIENDVGRAGIEHSRLCRYSSWTMHENIYSWPKVTFLSPILVENVVWREFSRNVLEPHKESLRQMIGISS